MRLNKQLALLSAFFIIASLMARMFATTMTMAQTLRPTKPINGSSPQAPAVACRYQFDPPNLPALNQVWQWTNYSHRKGSLRWIKMGTSRSAITPSSMRRRPSTCPLFGTGGGPCRAGGGPGLGGLSSGTVTGQTSTIPVGTLMIDLYDPTRKQLIWRGDATKTIDLKKDPDKNYKNLEKAMVKLFKNYPPPTKN